MGLLEQDIKYISKKLHLSPQIVQTLSEDDRDCNLLLSEASIKNFKPEDINKITVFTYIKLIIYRYSYDTGFDIDDKLYIAKCVFFHYPSIKKCLDYNLISSKNGPTERKSQYFLVLAGLCHDCVSPDFFYNGYKKFIGDGFRKNEKLREVSIFTAEWIEILREANSKGWFTPKIKKSQKLLSI